MRTVLIKWLGIWLLVATAISGGNVFAQDALAGYVREGLGSNLVLKQRNISLQRADYALKIAKSMFLPSVNLQMAYQTADGGRNIPLPIGDLLNPVYSTLNELTESNDFPRIENETINFLPRNYYDAHIRTTVPLINTDIVHNRRIQEQQVRLSELEVNTYKRELVKEIKTAYFNYLNAQQAIVIYQSALELAREGKRTNERLVENGKGLPAYVLRSASEVAEAEAKLHDAELKARNAQLYFNSLLNRTADAAIDTAFNRESALLQVADILGRSNGPVGEREELQSLATAIDIHETALRMNKQFAVPKLNAFLDLGSQSEGFHFNGQTRYYMAGLQLEFPIFNGNRNKYNIQQSRLDLQDAQLQLEQTQQQLQLASSVAYHNLQSAWQSYQSSKSQLEAAQAYQRLITRGYQAGSNSYIETVDARNQYTAASMALLINTYQVLSAAAALERENAGYLLIQ
ncbi:TolC family protein [Parapedobacter koreensis]|uniref:Outer membrane protein TolC n=1 Tax=Parapedobacter koreensis TaxID=332977 RepID=A0A1H7LBQ4_9SPHI|nr:TolC family protein [Parapedobacter koreensis]SEK96200.1 Outer membrane protein TolC [Parapedobacter koreensis]